MNLTMHIIYDIVSASSVSSCLEALALEILAIMVFPSQSFLTLAQQDINSMFSKTKIKTL